MVGWLRGLASCAAALALFAPAASAAPAGPSATVTLNYANRAHTLLALTTTAVGAPVCEAVVSESRLAFSEGIKVVAVAGQGSLSRATPLPGYLFGWRWSASIAPGSSSTITITVSAPYPAGEATPVVLQPSCTSGAGGKSLAATIVPSPRERAVSALTNALSDEQGAESASEHHRVSRFKRKLHDSVKQLIAAVAAIKEAINQVPDNEPSTAAALRNDEAWVALAQGADRSVLSYAEHALHAHSKRTRPSSRQVRRHVRSQLERAIRLKQKAIRGLS